MNNTKRKEAIRKNLADQKAAQIIGKMIRERKAREAKSDARYDRSVRRTATAERQPVSSLPLEFSARLLGETAGTRSSRKALLASRGRVVCIEKTPKRDRAVKNLLRLKSLPLGRLLRERSRTARRAATYKYAAQAATVGSTVREAYESAQTNQLLYLRQVNAEIQVRTILTYVH